MWKRRTYSDSGDRQVLQAPKQSRRMAVEFTLDTLADLCADDSFGRDVLVNVGAGRTVIPAEAPFFGQFRDVYLVEPDDERREALGQHPDAAGARLVGQPIQSLAAAGLPPADFVLCKWVLQHLPPDDVPGALEQLQAACAPGGTVGIYSSSSADDSYFVLSAGPEVVAGFPESLRPDEDQRLTRAQFEELITTPPAGQFIATHHIARSALVDAFAGWQVRTRVSPFGAVLLLARRP